jgi:hypothetical protein
MTTETLQQVRNSIAAQQQGLLTNPCAPGQETMKYVNLIELAAAIRIVDQLIGQEKASLCKPPGALGPVLVGV